MPYDPNFPASHAELTSDAFRQNFNGLGDKTDAILSGVGTGALPKKTGEGTLGNSAIAEDAANVMVSGKLLSVRRADTAGGILLEIHNGTEPVLHIRVTPDNGRIYFCSNRTGYSFQSPIDIEGAPVAMKPTSIGPFTGGFSDPPTQAEMQAFAGYVESLRAAL
ncbi:MAG: hypothetical protein NT105_18130 [Verrucomicrobia bacterium]|nr:hypothetical protein [Verrucomicrobiota bacterium]